MYYYIRASAQEAPQPIGAERYFDTLWGWFEDPATITAANRPWIASQCGGKGGIYVENAWSPFLAGKFGQYWQVRRPSPALLAWLDKQDGFINHAEPALDALFECYADREDANEYWRAIQARRHHNPEHLIKCPGSTRYDAPRQARRLFALYPTSYSRLTGELGSYLHFEARINRKEACEAAGIYCGNLAHFDLKVFWEQNLLGFQVDADRLGRLLRNRSNGTKYRKPLMVRIGDRLANADARLGQTILNYKESVQEVLDGFGGLRSLRPALVSVEIGSYLE